MNCKLFEYLFQRGDQSLSNVFGLFFFLSHHPSPQSYWLNAFSFFCLPFSFSCGALLFQRGILWFLTPNRCFVSLLPPFLASCRNSDTSTSLLSSPAMAGRELMVSCTAPLGRRQASIKAQAVRPSWCFLQTHLVPDKTLCRGYLPDFIWNWSFKDSGCVTVCDCPFICSFTCQVLLLWWFQVFIGM